MLAPCVAGLSHLVARRLTGEKPPITITRNHCVRVEPKLLAVQMLRKVRVVMLFIILGSWALMVPVQAGAAKKPWSGNAAAVAYYRTSSAMTNSLPVFQDVTTGYYWLWDDANVGGANSRFELNWGYATKPAADMVRAQATYEIQMIGGKQSWYTITFASLCASGSVCGSSIAPMELYVTKGGDFYGFYASGSNRVSCWTKATGSTAWIGKEFQPGTGWTTIGKFSPIVTKGNQVLITSTYPISDGSKVTETDSIDSATKLFTGSTYHVSRSTKPVYAPFSYSVVETHPSTTLTAPTVSLCS